MKPEKMLIWVVVIMIIFAGVNLYRAEVRISEMESQLKQVEKLAAGRSKDISELEERMKARLELLETSRVVVLEEKKAEAKKVIDNAKAGEVLVEFGTFGEIK